MNECVIQINIRDEDEGEVSVECCCVYCKKCYIHHANMTFYNDFTIALSFVTRDDMK